METVGIVAMLVVGAAAVGCVLVTVRAFSVMGHSVEAADRLVDAAYTRAGLLVKVEELRAANEALFVQHVQDTAEVEKLNDLIEEWATAYERLVDEIEEDDDGDWPEDEDEDEDPDDDNVVTESSDDMVVTDEMLRPTQASREWLRTHDIEWGEDGTG